MRKILCLLLVCLSLAGCGGEKPENEGYTFTDDLGRSVTVESPKRVAALLGSFAQVWQLAGGDVMATADDAWEDLGLSLGEDTVNLGNTKSLSLETLLAAQPDFILASANTRKDLEFREILEQTGIPTAYFSVSDFDSYLRMLKVCTDITGREDLYALHGTAVEAEIQAVRQQAEQRGTAPKVLCLRASAASFTVKNSRDNVLGEMLADLGCVNIADSQTSLLENLSLEAILAEDPEYIFIVQRGDDEEGMRRLVEELFASQPAWQQVRAVQEGKVFFMDKTLYNLKPNHRWGQAYAGLEDILEHG